MGERKGSGRRRERDSKERNRNTSGGGGTETQDSQRDRESERLGHPGDRINQRETSTDQESQRHSPRGSAQLCFLGKLLLISEPQFPYLSNKADQWPSLSGLSEISGLSHMLKRPEASLMAAVLSFIPSFTHINRALMCARHCTRHQGDSQAKYPAPLRSLFYYCCCCHGYYYITEA